MDFFEYPVLEEVAGQVRRGGAGLWMGYSQPKQNIKSGFPFIRLGEVMDHSAFLTLLFFCIVGFYIIKIAAFRLHFRGGEGDGFRRLVDLCSGWGRWIFGRLRWLAGLFGVGRCGVCGGDFLGKGGPGCGCGGIGRTGGGGHAKGRGGVNAQQGGGLDDGAIAGLALALHEHSKGLPGDIQGAGQGGGGGVHPAQLLEQFGWQHFDSPSYRRRILTPVIDGKQPVDVGNSAPAPAHFSPIYSAPGLVPSLAPPVFDRVPLADLAPGLPPVERGPVVAVIRLEDVKFSVQAAADYARDNRRNGIEGRGCSRWHLEQAAAAVAGWVAWSEPVAGGAA